MSEIQVLGATSTCGKWVATHAGEAFTVGVARSNQSPLVGLNGPAIQLLVALLADTRERLQKPLPAGGHVRRHRRHYTAVLTREGVVITDSHGSSLSLPAQTLDADLADLGALLGAMATTLPAPAIVDGRGGARENLRSALRRFASTLYPAGLGTFAPSLERIEHDDALLDALAGQVVPAARDLLTAAEDFNTACRDFGKPIVADAGMEPIVADMGAGAYGLETETTNEESDHAGSFEANEDIGCRGTGRPGAPGAAS